MRNRIPLGRRPRCVAEPNMTTPHPSTPGASGEWMGQKTLVVVPTYNEAENLPLIHSRLRSTIGTADLLIVDDGSPDGTGVLADRIATTDPQVHVLHRTAKGGLGAAYLAAFTWALDRDYDIIVQLDADGSHQPEELPWLLSALDDADLALGSRWVPGGKVINWPWHRLVLSRVGNRYARSVLGITLADPTGGFRAYRTDVLRALPLSDIVSRGYCFQVDMAYRAARHGFRITEVPITFIERVRGASKMNRRIVIEAFLRVTGWAMSRVLADRNEARRNTP